MRFWVEIRAALQVLAGALGGLVVGIVVLPVAVLGGAVVAAAGATAPIWGCCVGAVSGWRFATRGTETDAEVSNER